MMTTLKPGQIVKHYCNALHYGLQMEVKAVRRVRARVSFINIYGEKEELWIHQGELQLFDDADFPFLMSNQ